MEGSVDGFLLVGPASTPVLEVAYEQAGEVGATPVILLHGFPYDVRAYDEVAAILAAKGAFVVAPYLRGFGPTRFRDDTTIRSGQQGALAQDLLDVMNALNIETAVLAGYDWGGRAACIAAALWPTRVRGLVSVDGYNVQNLACAGEPAAPEWERTYWYQYYFHSERGRRGLDRNRDELCELLWRTWSPGWAGASAAFPASARSCLKAARTASQGGVRPKTVPTSRGLMNTGSCQEWDTTFRKRLPRRSRKPWRAC